MFQGGFVGKECEFRVVNPGEKEPIFTLPFYPEDVNYVQSFFF